MNEQNSWIPNDGRILGVGIISGDLLVMGTPILDFLDYIRNAVLPFSKRHRFQMDPSLWSIADLLRGWSGRRAIVDGVWKGERDGEDT